MIYWFMIKRSGLISAGDKVAIWQQAITWKPMSTQIFVTMWVYYTTGS